MSDAMLSKVLVLSGEADGSVEDSHDYRMTGADESEKDSPVHSFMLFIL
jgi:hypothetical protein